MPHLRFVSKGVNVIIIAPDQRDCEGGFERGLAKEWVSAEVRFRGVVAAALITLQVFG